MTNRNIFFISDHHFFHRNILKFTDDDDEPVRPWDTDELAVMHEHMVKKHNEVVKPQDHVWFGGDVFMGRYNAKEANNVLRRMNGHKRVLVGNHDNIRELAAFKVFEKIELWRMFPEHDFVFTHIPILLEVDTHGRRPKYNHNVHGHIHGNSIPDSRYINVSVEAVDYTPVSLEEIDEMIKYG